MKKLVLILGIIILTACSGQASSTSDPTMTNEQVIQIVSQTLTAAAPAVPPPQESTPMAKPTLDSSVLSVGVQLVVGTVKLEGTTESITSEQALVLIPLWTNLKTLMEINATNQIQGGAVNGEAQQMSTPQNQTEITTILQQIQDVLTAEQINAIVNINITQDVVTSFMEANNITTTNAGAQQGGSMGAGAGGTPPEGTPPAGGPGGDAGGPPSGGGGQPANGTGSATMQPGQGGMGERISTELIDLLLQLLQTKVPA